MEKSEIYYTIILMQQKSRSNGKQHKDLLGLTVGSYVNGMSIHPVLASISIHINKSHKNHSNLQINEVEWKLLPQTNTSDGSSSQQTLQIISIFYAFQSVS